MIWKIIVFQVCIAHFKFHTLWERVNEADKTIWEMHPYLSLPDPRVEQIQKGVYELYGKNNQEIKIPKELS